MCPSLRPLSAALMTVAVLTCNAGAADGLGAIALSDRGDLQAALQVAAAAAQKQPEDAEARFLHGVVLLELQRDAEALVVFTRMTQDFPELPDPFNNIALLQARAGHLEAARQALETALRNNPAHRTARVNLGHLHLMLAVQAWEQVAASAPLEMPLRRRLDAVKSLMASGPVAGR